MKKIIIFIFLTVHFSTIYSQIKFNGTSNKWMHNWTSFHPNLERYLEADKIIPNIISNDMTLSSDQVYLLSGNVYVTNKARLIIEPGTLIRCDHKNPASLIITRGSKLIAEGNKNEPIIFTSNKAPKSRGCGDWGGIVILGSGKLNTVTGVSKVEGDFLPKYSLYGGKKTNEETAILRYVRIEFPGQKINQSKELNGLTLCGVGSKTILDNIMVSYSADDSFEWFGGQGDFTNLISFKTKDDDYDVSNGFNGVLTNIVSIRHPYISDISGSYVVEIDGYNKKEGFSSEGNLSTLMIRKAMFVNLATQESIQFIKSSISARKLAKVSVESSCISGYSNVIKLDNSFKKQNQVDRNISFINNVFNISETGLNNKSKTSFDIAKLFTKNKFTTYFKEPKEIYENPFDENQPSFTLRKKISLKTML